MILAITNENEKLITEVCKECGEEQIQIFTGIKNLNRFAVQELRNLNNFKYAIIDITTTKESEEDIVKTIVTIKSMYNIRIIILALGYKQGNTLLAKLFNEGIYNFVIGKDYGTQKDELKDSLTGDGKQYKDAIRFRNQVLDTDKKNKVIIKKEYKKIKQFVNIAVIGTENKIGTTTQALLICTFFNSLNMNACYISNNEKDETSIIQRLINEKDKQNNNMLNYEGVDMYKKSSNMKAIDFGYDFYIYDYGVLTDEKINDFITKDIKIIVTGSKLWEFEGLFNAINKLEDLSNKYFLVNFTAEDKQKEIIKYRFPRDDKYLKSIFFTEYTPNPFVDNVNLDIYHKIFKDYIIEKSSKLTVLDDPKLNNIFNLFKRRK